MIETGYLQVLAAAALALLAFVLAKIKSIPVEKEIAFGSVRAFVQLIAVGYALEFIFKLDSIWLISLAVAIMIVVASYTASQRLPKSKRPFMASLIAITAGSVITCSDAASRHNQSRGALYHTAIGHDYLQFHERRRGSV